MRRIAILVLGILLAAPAGAQTSARSEPAARPDGWVVLTVAEYRALREKAYPPAPVPEAPPVPATIARIDYDLAVQGDAATGQARLTIDVFQDGWVSIPIPPGLRVRDARIDGKPVTLVHDGDGDSEPAVLLSRPGRSTLALDIAVPVSAKAGQESLALPPSDAPVQRVALSLRAADLALAVSGGFLAEKSAGGGSNRYVIGMRVAEPLAVSWGRRLDTPSVTQPLRLRGAITETVGLNEDSAQVSAQVGLEVMQGLAERVTLALPKAFAVNQVSGALVGDWEVRGNDLVVSLLKPVERSTSLTISGEVKTLRDGKIGVPLVRVSGAERESGGVAVEVLGAGEITEHVTRGLDPADPADLGPAVAARQSPALVAFRLRPLAGDAPRSLDVTVARYTPQSVPLANIDEARFTGLASEDGKTLIEAAYAVRNSQRSFVSIVLPQGAALWSASVDGRAVRPGRTAEGALLLPILKDRARSEAESVVRVLYVDRSSRWPENGITAVRLPTVDLPVSRSGLVLHHSPRYRLTLESGPFRVEEFAPPQSAALRGNRAAVAGGGPARRTAALDEMDRAADQEMRELVSTYQRASGGRGVTGLLPIDIPFPSLGPSIFLAAELTPEGKTPEPRFTVKREVK